MASQIITTSVSGMDSSALARETAHQLRREAAGNPIKGGVLFCTVETQVESFRRALAEILPRVPFIGATSCLGVGVSTKFLSGEPGVGGFWFAGDDVVFGVHTIPLRNDPESSGRELAKIVLEKSGLTKEQADFAFFLPTPGHEETLLKGVYELMGEDTVIIGGTAADNDLSGKWRTWSHDFSTDDGVSLAIGSWPKNTAVSYRGGYLSTDKKARVTKSVGRVLHELDGEPAAVVYNKWVDGKLDEYLERGGSVLGVSTLNPLGIVRGSFGGLDAFVLIHPETVIAESGALTTFAEIKEGETVYLMQSTKRSLVKRGSNVAQWSMNLGGFEEGDIAGGFMVYCGGCVLAIRDEIEEMLSLFSDKLGGAPWISYFSFGEQGCVIPRKVDHGNLMNAVLLFEK